MSLHPLLHLALYKVQPDIHLLLAILLLPIQVLNKQPFFLIAIDWSHFRCSVDSNILFFKNLFSLKILFEYSLRDISVSSKGLFLWKHFITTLFTSLFNFTLAVAVWRLGLHCCVGGKPARWRTFTWCCSLIHAIILKNLTWHFQSFEVLVTFRLHKH